MNYLIILVKRDTKFPPSGGIIHSDINAYYINFVWKAGWKAYVHQSAVAVNIYDSGGTVGDSVF